MKQIKRAFSLVLCISLLLSMLLAFPRISNAAVVSASATTAFSDQSGDLSIKPLTKEEILQTWRALDLSYDKEYEIEPSVSAPYSIGKLDADYLQSGENYLNFMRYAAHLPAIEMTDELNEAAQYGAVLLAASNYSHYPDQPADMDDDFYQKGYDATSSSNIAYGYPVSNMSINKATTGFMKDSQSNNLATLGHRRWFLNPTLKYVGFGYADNGEKSFVDTKVFDRSGEDIDYNFISWPPSGNYLKVISADSPFSITLNPEKYKSPEDSDVKITVTRQSDGKVWTFDSTTSRTPGSSKYMLIEKSWYAINNCIIFRPDIGDLSYVDGVYTFSISGIYYLDGAEATINYYTDFFDEYYTKHSSDPNNVPVVWNTPSTNYYGDLTENEFEVGTTITFKNRKCGVAGYSIIVEVSDAEAVKVVHNDYYFSGYGAVDYYSVDFLKEGIYTITITLADSPEITETFTFYIGAEAPTDIKKGDLNGDGEIDMRDYALLKRYCFGTAVLNDSQLALADINSDGEIDMRDYSLLKRYCFGTYVIE